jgi:hypothetical protein
MADGSVEAPLLPVPGQWTERLAGQASFTTAPGQVLQLTIPSNYGRIWTSP